MHLTNSTTSVTVRHRRLLRDASLALGCAALFGLLAALVMDHWHPLYQFDQDWISELHDYAREHRIWTAAVQTLSDIGGPVTMRALLGIAAAWLWLIGARVLAGWVAAQALVGWGAQWALKLAVDRQRPAFSDPVSHAGGPAFPSGHAMASAITCAVLVGLLWYRVDRRGRTAACAVATATVLTIGWTRTALGVHWPSDVVAGWLAAGVVLGAVTAAIELWRPGALARDVRRVNWRTRPRVQRVIVPPVRAPRTDDPLDGAELDGARLSGVGWDEPGLDGPADRPDEPVR
ncbi:phosphatase PAP2 family protein [Kitasatospora cathayae]|uniref:Phosphatase PAP2 family protein n=1 Tax=Kitasatospora cathayae TaxID=3004092 RepID=A0ABY7Q3Y0_9ACTN|nr:phosphatase PAP2 family protein [Kitasatospora sp. HUAS 3-15]WBP87341.1 phosphatase PAP2 family protein [Kitasatospora sp. HUAS 3-15]